MTAAVQVIVYSVAVACAALAALALLALGVQLARLAATLRVRRELRRSLTRIGAPPRGPFAELGRAFEQIRDAFYTAPGGDEGSEDP